MSHKFTLTLLLLLLPLALEAKKWRADNIEMVYLKDSTQYVCNPDGVLGQNALQVTNQILRSLETDKGVQTVVVVVKQLEGDDPFSFGMDLSRRYGIGNKQSTGLILILATEDRSYQILTGHGLEGTLPDALCNRVESRIMVPLLKKGDWDAAIVETVKALDKIIRGDDSIANDTDDDDPWSAIIVGVCTILGAILLFFLLVYFSQKNCPKCGTKHSCTIAREEFIIVEGNRRKRTTWRCRKCGHTFITETDENNLHNPGSGIGPTLLMGGMRGGSGRGFGGGSFGGGSFGGGGAGGRF